VKLSERSAAERFRRVSEGFASGSNVNGENTMKNNLIMMLMLFSLGVPVSTIAAPVKPRLVVLTDSKVSAKPIVHVGIADDKDTPAVKFVGTAKRAGDGSFQLIDGAPWGWIKVGENAMESLKGLRSFTIMGWVKPDSLQSGHGGNRILFCLKENRSGIDLVHHNDGRMRLSVNEWPDQIQNDSSAGKLQVGKWTFFAVSYDSTASSDNVSWYFSTPSDTPRQSTVSLDQKTFYNPGPVDSDVGPLVVGNFNETMEAYGMDRQFRGEIRALQIFGSSKDGNGALKADEIGSRGEQMTVDGRLFSHTVVVGYDWRMELPCDVDKTRSILDKIIPVNLVAISSVIVVAFAQLNVLIVRHDKIIESPKLKISNS
jgi:hypothetical protein